MYALYCDSIGITYVHFCICIIHMYPGNHLSIFIIMCFDHKADNMYIISNFANMLLHFNMLFYIQYAVIILLQDHRIKNSQDNKML